MRVVVHLVSNRFLPKKVVVIPVKDRKDGVAKALKYAQEGVLEVGRFRTILHPATRIQEIIIE